MVVSASSVPSVLITLLVLITAALVPLQLAFDLELHVQHPDLLDRVYLFEIVSDIIFCVDILVNFRTGYMQRGLFVRHWRLAAIHYLKTSFALDLISSFPLTLILEAAAAPQRPLTKHSSLHAAAEDVLVHDRKRPGRLHGARREVRRVRLRVCGTLQPRRRGISTAPAGLRTYISVQVDGREGRPALLR